MNFYITTYSKWSKTVKNGQKRSKMDKKVKIMYFFDNQGCEDSSVHLFAVLSFKPNNRFVPYPKIIKKTCGTAWCVIIF